MPEVIAPRLPVPHLFMVASIGSFAVMMVSAFAPAAADDGAQGAAAPDAGAVDPAVAAVDGLTVGSLVALLALLTITVGAGRVGTHGSGRPMVGLVAGLLAGLAGATSLFSVGTISLGSPAWIYLPLASSTLGTALASTAPLPRR